MRKKNIVHKISKTFSQHNKKYLTEKIFKKLQKYTTIKDIPIDTYFVYYVFENEKEKDFFFLREQSEQVNDGQIFGNGKSQVQRTVTKFEN
jgi:hypothetical protein